MLYKYLLNLSEWVNECMNQPCPHHLNLTVASLFTVQMRKPQFSKGSKPAWMVGSWPKSQSHEFASGAVTSIFHQTELLLYSAWEIWNSTQPGTLSASPGSALKPVWTLGSWLRCAGCEGNPWPLTKSKAAGGGGEWQGTSLGQGLSMAGSQSRHGKCAMTIIN